MWSINLAHGLTYNLLQSVKILNYFKHGQMVLWKSLQVMLHHVTSRYTQFIWVHEYYAHYTVFRVGRFTFFLVNRVENQNEPKRPKGGGRLGSFWFSTRPSANTGTGYNLHHALIISSWCRL